MERPQTCAISEIDTDPGLPETPEYRIWNTDLSVGVLVDYEDYVEAIKYSWNTQKPCKKNRRMGYMRRNRYIPGTRQAYDVNGETRHRRQFETIYLHVWVLERSGKHRPPGCYLAEHVNGQIYDCRRDNLEWGSTSSNALTRERQKKARRAREDQSGEAAQPSRSHRPQRRQAGLPALSPDDTAAGDPSSIPF